MPGEVHPQLTRAGVIQNPLEMDNSEKCLWIEEKHWYYRRTFHLPPDFIRSQTYIEMDGLDTFATVLLNGEKIGSAENMFVPYRFDVTGKTHQTPETTTGSRGSTPQAASSGRSSGARAWMGTAGCS